MNSLQQIHKACLRRLKPCVLGGVLARRRAGFVILLLRIHSPGYVHYHPQPLGGLCVSAVKRVFLMDSPHVHDGLGIVGV